MAVELFLKSREVDNVVSLKLDMLKAILRQTDEEAKRDLLRMFTQVKDSPGKIHDKHWLKTIVDWQPKGGRSMSDTAKWFKLIKRVNNLDDEKEGPFTLSSFQSDLVWGVLKHDEFMTGTELPLIEFVIEYQRVSGKHFETEDPDIFKDDPKQIEGAVEEVEPETEDAMPEEVVSEDQD